MRTASLVYFYHIPIFAAWGLWGCWDKEKERKKNYSFKIKADNVKDSYNTHLSEYEKRQTLLTSLSKKIKEFYRLRNIAATVSYSLTVQEITEKVTQMVSQTIEKGDTYAFFLVHPATRALKLGTSILRKGVKPEMTVDSTDDFNKWIMQQRQPLFISDVEKDYRFDRLKGNFNKNIKSLIATPLTTEDKMLGVLRVDKGFSRDLFNEPFTMEDLRLLAAISNLAALSIKNAMLYKETEELGIKDGLTSLYVLRHFKEVVSRLIASVPERKLVLLMLDLDKFKSVNDQYGHLAGDAVLTTVASILKKESGRDALVSRYGGEEFAIVMPEINKEQGLAIAENIRAAVEGCTIRVRRETISVTISIGLAIYPKNGRAVDPLIECADKALYSSKTEGRNRITVC
ncbi:diguanylate cyclase [Candidatus Auribacterota bacterium]